jgi:hypothetical protein
MNTALVPFDDDDGFSRVARHRSARALRAHQRAELEVALHGLRVDVAVTKENQESNAIGAVVTFNAEEEMAFLDYGMARANGSAAKLEVVARLANLQQSFDTRRLLRKWGR